MKIGIIVGSIRNGRVGRNVGEWVLAEASQRDDATFELIDLAEFDVPLFDSPVGPMMAKKQYAHEGVQRWSKAIDECDGFIYVTPEYNHSVPGAFKNACDWLGPEWMFKTVAFVSYGADGGVRATEAWRLSVANFSMLDIRTALALNRFTEFGQDGSFHPNERRSGELKTLLDHLVASTRVYGQLRLR